MSNKIILKRSATAAKVPLLSDLDYGELALNYNDGKLYYKKSDGVTPANDIISSISGGGGASVYTGITAPTDPNVYPLWWDSTSGSLKIYYVDANTSQWVDAYSPTISGNGMSITISIDGGSSTTAFTATDIVFDGGSA